MNYSLLNTTTTVSYESNYKGGCGAIILQPILIFGCKDSVNSGMLKGICKIAWGVDLRPKLTS